MTAKPNTPVTDVLDCHICLNEIPNSVEQSLEGPDYVYFYFGAQCYAMWRAQQEQRDKERSDPDLKLVPR